MKFEVQHALVDLDQRTPAFYLEEMFAHADLKVRMDAVEVLNTLEPETRSNRILQEILKIA